MKGLLVFHFFNLHHSPFVATDASGQFLWATWLFSSLLYLEKPNNNNNTKQESLGSLMKEYNDMELSHDVWKWCVNSSRHRTDPSWQIQPWKGELEARRSAPLSSPVRGYIIRNCTRVFPEWTLHPSAVNFWLHQELVRWTILLLSFMESVLILC